MRQHPYRRWVCGLLAGLSLLLLACGVFVWAVDPCLYYRVPEKAVFFNERYQNAGLLRHARADTVLLGTSMVANYRPSQVESVFGGSAVKLTVPDGYMSEFDTILSAAFRAHPPERVIFGLDANILIRDESGLTGALPAYLYNANPLDDMQYLLNRDTLYYSVYALLAARRGDVTAVDDAFTWDDTVWWNHMTVMDNYERPDPVEETLPADVYLEHAEANLAVIEGWIAAHPDTEFDIFLPPYSILFWDKMGRLGETDAVFAALELACETLLQYGNVRFYNFLMDADIVTNLDNYCDYIHHSSEAAGMVLEKMRAGDCLVTAENWRETLANWRDFVVNYDYEPYWTDPFWWAWNKTHGGN